MSALRTQIIALEAIARLAKQHKASSTVGFSSFYSQLKYQAELELGLAKL